MNVTLKYNQMIFDCGYRIEELFGCKTIVWYNNGLVAFPQEEEINRDDVEERIKTLKSYTNRKYKDFRIIN